MFIRTVSKLKSLTRTIWYPPECPPEVGERLAPNLGFKLFPKEILKSLEAHGEEFGELEERPQLTDMPLQIIEYNKDEKKYSINEHKADVYFDEHTAIVVGIIGAFVPECTREVAYDWACAAEAYDLKFGINKVILISQNDPFVMLKFAEKLGYEQSLSFIADWNGAFNSIIGHNIEHSLELGVRNHRYLSFVRYKSIRVAHSSYYNQMFYTNCIHPIFVWQRLVMLRKVPIYYN